MFQMNTDFHSKDVLLTPSLLTLIEAARVPITWQLSFLLLWLLQNAELCDALRFVCNHVRVMPTHVMQNESTHKMEVV